MGAGNPTWNASRQQLEIYGIKRMDLGLVASSKTFCVSVLLPDFGPRQAAAGKVQDPICLLLVSDVDPPVMREVRTRMAGFLRAIADGFHLVGVDPQERHGLHHRIGARLAQR